ncbi:hypothetical protein Tco_0913459 [Tanacetum coccineum]
MNKAKWGYSMHGILKSHNGKGISNMVFYSIKSWDPLDHASFFEVALKDITSYGKREVDVVGDTWTQRTGRAWFIMRNYNGKGKKNTKECNEHALVFLMLLVLLATARMEEHIKLDSIIYLNLNEELAKQMVRIGHVLDLFAYAIDKVVEEHAAVERLRNGVTRCIGMTESSNGKEAVTWFSRKSCDPLDHARRWMLLEILGTLKVSECVATVYAYHCASVTFQM